MPSDAWTAIHPYVDLALQGWSIKVEARYSDMRDFKHPAEPVAAGKMRPFVDGQRWGFDADLDQPAIWPNGRGPVFYRPMKIHVSYDYGPDEFTATIETTDGAHRSTFGATAKEWTWEWTVWLSQRDDKPPTDYYLGPDESLFLSFSPPRTWAMGFYGVESLGSSLLGYLKAGGRIDG